MRSGILRRATRVSAIAVALAVVGFLSTGGFGGSRSSSAQIIGVTSTAAEQQARQHFLISGFVTGLYPGQTKPLVLKVRNPFSSPLTVTEIRIKVTQTNHAGCPATDLTATNFSGALLVPPGGQATTTVSVTMSGDAANACQGARFRMKYQGRGEKA
jgi:hypothetical protein